MVIKRYIERTKEIEESPIDVKIIIEGGSFHFLSNFFTYLNAVSNFTNKNNDNKLYAQ